MVEGSVNCCCTWRPARCHTAAGQSLLKPKSRGPRASPLPRGEAGWRRAALGDKCGASPLCQAPLINPPAPAQGHPSTAVHEDCSCALRIAAVQGDCSHVQPCAAAQEDCSGVSPLEAAGCHKPRHSSSDARAGIRGQHPRTSMLPATQQASDLPSTLFAGVRRT